jgi:hypothetical protein
MTENFKGENALRERVQKNVKTHLIDTKYPNEGISFGQAVVTHHYLNNAPQPAQAMQFHPAQSVPNPYAQPRDGARSRSPQKEMMADPHSVTMSNIHQSQNQSRVIQFDKEQRGM